MQGNCIKSPETERRREGGLLQHEIHDYSEHRRVKKSHVDAIIAAGRGTAGIAEKGQIITAVKKLETRNESVRCGFNVPRYFATKQIGRVDGARWEGRRRSRRIARPVNN